MQVVDQTLDEIVESLSPLDVNWMDETAAAALAKLAALPKKDRYTRDDVGELLDADFEIGILCARLFLGLSKDPMESALRDCLGKGGTGVTSFRQNREAYLDALDALRLPEAMTTSVNYQPVWSDILKERLRSGRGSAVSGQKRGRALEDFAEALVREVFGDAYGVRCTFVGADGTPAKCDIAIPDRNRPRVLIESKAYGATGSKMTDIIGDLDAIIKAKRHDTTLLFVTDGTSWRARLSDLRKAVQRQNTGQIARIYTTNMREQFLADLQTLKLEAGL